MELIAVCAFYVGVFAGVLVLRHAARADRDQWIGESR
jgi:hypothetical protein